MAPSRHSNPFATCWTRPAAAPFVPPAGAAPRELLLKLAALDWQAELLGPHGVGKSTLLRQLQPLAEAAGRVWLAVEVRPEKVSQAYRQLRAVSLSPSSLVVIDGFEQLSRWQRWRLQWRCQRARAGLLVTTHLPTRLPTLASLQPNLERGLQVFSQLTVGRGTEVTAEDFRNAFNACEGNLREAFFNLYDLHERRNRTAAGTNNAAGGRVEG